MPRVSRHSVELPDGVEFYLLDTEHETLALVVHASVTASPQRTQLTSTEHRVMQLVLDGCSNEEIASRRSTSKRTVVNQLSSIFRKLGVGSRRELKAAFRALPLI